jgi:hypothetical protein
MTKATAIITPVAAISRASNPRPISDSAGCRAEPLPASLLIQNHPLDARATWPIATRQGNADDRR